LQEVLRDMEDEDEIDKIRQFCLTVAEYTVCFIDAENVLNGSNTEAYETSEIPCGSMRITLVSNSMSHGLGGA
jgi:hypothetical protein